MAAGERPIRGLRMPRCQACRLHEIDCACALLPRLRSDTTVVLYVHSHELYRPSNTGWLVARVLSGARLVVHGSGERSGWHEDPASPAMVLHPDGRELTDADRGRLLVPDGSWSQARRMLHRLPALRGGELVRLPNSRAAAGDADLSWRRAPQVGHVCTYEAVARALGIIESAALERRMLEVLRLVVRRSKFRRRFPHAAALASLKAATPDGMDAAAHQVVAQQRSR